MLTRIVYAFEAAYQRGEEPDIDSHLAEAGDETDSVLRELIFVDLEYRDRRNLPIRAERYLHSHPDLRHDTALLLAIVRAEIRSRLRAGEPFSHEQVLERFPELAAEQLAAEQLAAETDKGHSTRPPRVGDASVPDLVGYEMLGELGRGGMGVVYKARHRELDRLVAVKMIRGSAIEEEDATRFRNEARAVARLSHPNIVRIHEIGEHANQPFFSLEFCAGGSLDRRLNAAPMPPREAATLVATLAAAMQTAHEAGVIHRDLKPANVLLTEKGEPRITDFGLARKVDDPALTRSGAIVGTPSYMAPEQARGEKAGPAADLYALGAILYECLTGRPPFRAASVYETILQVTDTDPVPPRALVPSLPRDLETITLKCLQKAPERRYGSAKELAEDLDRYLAGMAIRARPVGPGERLLRWAARRPGTAALTASLVLVLVVGTAVSLYLAYERDQARLDAESRAKTEEAARIEANSQREEAKRRKVVADNLRVEADQARTRAEDNARESRLQRLRAEEALTANRLTAARLLFKENSTPQALAQLRSVPFDRRRWDWYWLRRHLEGSEQTLVGCYGNIPAAVWSPDGERIAAGDDQGRICLWNAKTGQLILGFRVHADGVGCLAFDPTGKRLVSGERNLNSNPIGRINTNPSRPGEVSIWNTATGEELVSLKDHTAPLTAVAWSSDGKWLATAASHPVYHPFPGEVILRDGKTGKAVAKPLPLPANAVAFHPSEPVLAIADLNGTCRLIDLGNPKEPKERTIIRLVEADPEKPDTKPDSTRITLAVAQPNPTRTIAFSPEGDQLYLSGNTAVVQIYDWKTGKELRRFGAKGGVFAMALDPSGKRLSTSGVTLGIPLFDTAKGQELPTLRGHFDLVRRTAFHPTENRLLSCAADSTVRVWNLEANEGESIPVIPSSGSAYSLAGIAWSRDGQTFVVGSGTRLSSFAKSAVGKQEYHVYHRQSRRLLVTYRGHQAAPRRVAMHPWLPIAATLADKGPVHLWSTDTGELLRKVGAEEKSLNAFAFTPDGRSLLAASSNELGLYDLATGKPRLTIADPEPGYTVALALVPDGKRFVTFRRNGSNDTGTIRIFALEPSAIRPLRDRFVTRRDPNVLAVSPDGRWCAFGTGSTAGIAPQGEAYRMDLESDRPPEPLPDVSGPVLGLAFTRDSERLAVAEFRGAVRIHELTSRQATLTLQPRGSAESNDALAFSPDGEELALVGDRTVHLWNSREDRIPIQELGEQPAYAITHSPDRRTLVRGEINGTITFTAVETGEELRRLEGPKQTRELAFSPDGRYLAAIGGATNIKLPAESRLWDLQTGTLVHRHSHTEGAASSVAFLPDGKRYMTAGADIRIWNLQGKLLARLSENGFALRAVVTPEERILMGRLDGSVIEWDPKTDKCRRIVRLTAPARGLSLHPDGTTIAVATGTALFLLDRATGRQTGRMAMAPVTVTTTAWHPGGRYLAASGENSEIRVWDTTEQRVVARYPGHAWITHGLLWLGDNRLASTGNDRECKVWRFE